MKRHAWAVLLVLVVAAAAVTAVAAPADAPPAKRKRAAPPEYGRVVIANRSEAARLAPVVFDHWLHRASYTCRVCHVDVGFAMRAGATGITAADNAAGQYCGACHDGKRQGPGGKKIFASCTKTVPADDATCVRCHSAGKGVRPEHDFAAFAKNLPRERFGNGIDWEKAELDKLVRPADFVEGISIKRPALPAQKDFALTAKLEGMPNIIFSHAKHTVWNGCELCHPDIFAVRRGGRAITMVQIFEGQYCGACHTQVAFPLIDCQRCHSAPVQMPVK
jgi:c(7)-type cytochrome triheme protein